MNKVFLVEEPVDAAILDLLDRTLVAKSCILKNIYKF